MIIKMKYVIINIVILLLFSCNNSKREHIANLLMEWESKEFIFPSNFYFTTNGKDSIDYEVSKLCKYKIVMYADSIGCTSCKLRLSAWKSFMSQIDSLSSETIQFLFFFFPKNKVDISDVLKADNFEYPVCIDEQDSLNILNHIPTEFMFQTFLLDENNRVIAIGNPVYNPRIKELYLNIITGKNILSEELDNKMLTTVVLSTCQLDMGSFDWKKEQLAEFLFTNSGTNPFVIEDAYSSCGCISVEYSKELIQSGKSVNIKVKYKAEHPEHFDKTIMVYCNAENNPLRLRIVGNAK